MLRSAPGSLKEQLPHLAQSLASLAALAHIPVLAAGCFPAPECADQGASEGHTALSLCVCTRPTDTLASPDEEAADGVAADVTAAASMWLHKAPITGHDIEFGLFNLESRPV